MIGLGVMDFFILRFCDNSIVIICRGVAEVALKFVFASSVLFSRWVQIAFFVHIIIDLRSHFFIYCLCGSCFWNMRLNIITMENRIMPRGRIHLGNVLTCFIFFVIVSFIRLYDEQGVINTKICFILTLTNVDYRAAMIWSYFFSFFYF